MAIASGQPDVSGQLFQAASGSAAAVHAFSAMVTLVASLSIVLAIGWYVTRRPTMSRPLFLASVLVAIYALANGITQGLDFFLVRGADAMALTVVEALTSLVVVIAGIAVWALMPRLVALPSTRDLLDANVRLEAEEQKRLALVEELTRFNEELESRVATRTRDLLDARRRFEIALDGTNITVCEQDRDLRYTWVYNYPASLALEDIIGKVPSDFLTDEDATALNAAKLRVLETGVPEKVEVKLHRDGQPVYFDERIEAVWCEEKVIGIVTSAVDVTKHKRAEMQMRVVLRELTHRSKNLLAVVQGVARQTAETVETLPDFTSRFAARLQALSGAHELLVKSSWEGVELGELFRRLLLADLTEEPTRIAIDGPVLMLGPELAQNLALAIHEMNTNCQAHGALSAGSGKLQVSWRLEENESRPVIRLDWIESGAPVPLSPTRSGFGRLMIERLLPRAISGESKLDLAGDGARWSLVFPATAAAQAPVE